MQEELCFTRAFDPTVSFRLEQSICISRKPWWLGEMPWLLTLDQLRPIAWARGTTREAETRRCHYSFYHLTGIGRLYKSIMKSSIAAAAAVFGGLTCASLYGESNLNHTCVLVPEYLSCSPQANAATVDSCCVETYGGLFLSTQFWSVYTGLESHGQKLPAFSWTLHGLWPDFCNGTYGQYCDLSRQYDRAPSPNTTNGFPNGTIVPPYKGPSIQKFALEKFGRYDLIEWMNKYWIAQGQPNYEFWEHEFSKHATCYSTFDVPCFGPKYVQHQEIIEFFETAIMYYLRLPTWGWLGAHGIYPSNSTTYTLSHMESALKQEYGALPYLGCTGPRYNETAAGKGSLDNGKTQFSEVWYNFHSYGRPQNGGTSRLDNGFPSNCAKTTGAVHYYERASGSEVRY
ncbi:ribonuclease T2 [Acrodontium crateriforme]|uniref:ribonuclease T2 n=1 Tax=Acrodontium crateriforme TaxID=150365 RepID=A0AAQ3MAH5_9PEZI|nr:ribonuclease T2 [Acrodontium crateriforme]